MPPHDNPWRRLSTRPIYDNPWITVEEDQVINPGGGQNLYGRVMFKNRAVGIIPVDEDRNTYLVGQWRYPLDRWSWEIPEGGSPLEADVLDSAKRELQEETGLRAKQWQQICHLHTSNSVTNEEGFLFIASELEQGETSFDETERIELRKLPFVEAISMVMDGEITDCMSIAGLLKARQILGW